MGNSIRGTDKASYHRSNKGYVDEWEEKVWRKKLLTRDQSENSWDLPITIRSLVKSAKCSVFTDFSLEGKGLEPLLNAIPEPENPAAQVAADGLPLPWLSVACRRGDGFISFQREDE